MADSAFSPEDPIRITCFQPVYSVMDSYGPICFVKAANANSNDNDARDNVQRAIRENPRNGTLSFPPFATMSHEGPIRLAMMVGNLWAPGRELKIGFQEGSAWQKEQVKKYAPEWCQHANIKFTFLDSGEVDILIAFDPTDGSWSYLGTGSSGKKPSMNLGWVNENRRPDDIRSTILHEFGHALGAVHEHQSPNASIQWNKEKVYEDLGGPPNHWDRATVDKNMFTVYTMPSVKPTPFDPDSVMLYYFPASWTLDGKGTTWNTSLSVMDKGFAKFSYPAETFDSVPFDTGELHPWDKPQQDNVKPVWCYQKYAAAPALVLGLTSLDIDRGANIRICAYSSDVTPETYKLYLQSWGDTVLYSASLACLEASAERFSY
ncbi:zincin-like metalloprotease, partial [Phanerochaete sordida]